MGFKEKNNDQINDEQIKLVEAAQKRVRQKKILFYHFSLMIFGNISFIILEYVFTLLFFVIIFKIFKQIGFSFSSAVCGTLLILFL